MAGLEGRIRRLEARAGAGTVQLVVVFEAEDGSWRDGRGEPVERGALPPGAHVVVIRSRPDGPQ
jgi:hypothetical protein